MPYTDELAKRMKSYEAEQKTVLPSKSLTITRVDGRAFHSYTRDCERPFDQQLMDDMDATAVALCEEISGARFGFVQSDEISVLSSDMAKEGTQAWFGGVVAKHVSISASVATATLNALRPGHGRALFDSRVFTVPSQDEAMKYFVWRQADARTNSISMAAQAQFSHKSLQNKGVTTMQRMLTENGTPWMDLPQGFRQGRLISPIQREETVTYTRKDTGEVHSTLVMRNRWEASAAPLFSMENMKGF